MKKLSPISVTLGDCLACSGCITSAEVVLISEQSHEKVLKILDDKQKGLNQMIFVISMSLQALASIAAKYQSTIQSTAEHLAYFFHHELGIDYIFDLSLARHLCLIECGKELLKEKTSSANKIKNDSKPILSSTCPGFVCYAEKSQGSILVPKLSRVKSPQQIMGLLVKQRLNLVDSNLNLKNQKIYHITLMPCYDKKLEASRLENKFSDDNPEVDCVLTPIEIEKIFEFKQINDLNSLSRRKLDSFLPNSSSSSSMMFGVDDFSKIYSHLGSGSGAYAETLLHIMALHQNLAQEIIQKPDEPLQWKMIRNSDFLEFALVSEEKPLISFAILNGFRNVQNLVSRLKRKTCNYDYIEVSACPKGCLNGGAQHRNLKFNPELNKQTKVDSDPVLITYEQVENLYKQLPNYKFDYQMTSEQNQKLYQLLQLNDEFCQKFQTKFYALEKKFNILNSNW